ncbi:MAG: acyltransferase [Ruminococcus sp.]|nr:acyltransferase [Ruminococcus sp.]
MNSTARKHYVDNLRWMLLLILIPYHTAMAWNVWEEPNYIFFEGNKIISSIVVFFSPYFMSLMFVLAGISMKNSLRKRTKSNYLLERVKRLLVPFLFGTLVLMPVMSYFADKFNCSYTGGFIEHYGIFFTKLTDLTGADGGFSVGQFWFLLYLLVISVIGIGILTLFEKFLPEKEKTIPFWAVILLGLPLPLLSEILSVGGKSLAEYTYLFMMGYYVFSKDEIISKLEKYKWLMLCIGISVALVNIYLFIWSEKEYALLNTLMKYITEWFMTIALAGLAKGYLNFTGKVTGYMSKRSFLVYTWHFIWVVMFQYILYQIVGNNTFILFTGTVILSYVMTFICCEISMRISVLCFLTGNRYEKNNP